MSDTDPQAWMRVGMLAAVRDIQDFVEGNTRPISGTLKTNDLRAYLYALLITAGGFEDDDGQS